MPQVWQERAEVDDTRSEKAASGAVVTGVSSRMVTKAARVAPLSVPTARRESGHRGGEIVTCRRRPSSRIGARCERKGI